MRKMEKTSLKLAAEAVLQMEQYLRETVWRVNPQKSWENTHIKHQIDRRKAKKPFFIQDHIRAMVYSFLSSGIVWARLEPLIEEHGRIPKIDDIFQQYEPNFVLDSTSDKLYNKIQQTVGGTPYLKKQLDALIGTNIKKLKDFEAKHGSIEAYYNTFPTIKDLIRSLSEAGNGSPNSKMEQMGIALVSEYLRNVGYDIAKPDRHVRRILGSKRLGLSEKEDAGEYEALKIVEELAKQAGKSVAETDYILWSYCATGYTGICTKSYPNCHVCRVKDRCRYAKS